MVSVNKSESKYFNTALLMDEALLLLLEKKDFDIDTIMESECINSEEDTNEVSDEVESENKENTSKTNVTEEGENKAWKWKNKLTNLFFTL